MRLGPYSVTGSIEEKGRGKCEILREVKAEEEIAVMQPQVKEGLGPPEAVRGNE